MILDYHYFWESRLQSAVIMIYEHFYEQIHHLIVYILSSA